MITIMTLVPKVMITSNNKWVVFSEVGLVLMYSADLVNYFVMKKSFTCPVTYATDYSQVVLYMC